MATAACHPLTEFCFIGSLVRLCLGFRSMLKMTLYFSFDAFASTVRHTAVLCIVPVCSLILYSHFPHPSSRPNDSTPSEATWAVPWTPK